MTSTSGPADPSEPTSGDERERSSSPLMAALGVLALAAALAAPLAPAGSVRAVAIVCGILAAVGLTLNVIWGRGRRAIAIGSGLLIAVAAGSAGAAFVRSVQSTGSSHVAKHRSPLPVLRILQPPHGLIPWCSTVEGTGTIPSGDSLLIFDRQVGPDNLPSLGSVYSLDGPVVPLGSSWSITPVYIGMQKLAGPFYDELTGVLVTNRTAGFILR